MAAPAMAPMDAVSSRGSSDAKTDETPKTGGAPPPPPTTPAQNIPVAGQTAQQRQAQDDRAQQETPHETTMLIYTASITMAVYQVEPGLAAIEKIGRDFGGYLAVKTDQVITIRVPRGKFDDALKEVEKVGDVIHRDVTAEDVTDQFVDLDARLRNAKAMRDRLQELLKKANTKEALEIEVQLERVMGEIESMEGKLKLLKDKIAFSMITVTFAPRGQAAVRDMPLRLPFPWLSGLGLGRLLSLSE